ncbi:hypothetical protein Tco_1147278 [Tanacetum coccineum]
MMEVICENVIANKRVEHFCRWEGHIGHYTEDDVLYTILNAPVFDKYMLTMPVEYSFAHELDKYKKAVLVHDDVSTNINSSTNEADNTVYGVSSAHTQSSPTSGDNLSDAEMAILTIRARRFIKRTGRQLDVNGQRVGFDKSKVKIGGYDWSYQAEEEHLTNYALMAHTSSGSSSNSDSEKLEKAEKERDELKLTLEKFQNSSKSLNNLLESQIVDKFKTEVGYNATSSTAASPVVESFVNSSKMLENQEYNTSKYDKGYHAVPPPYTGNFIPFKPDLKFMD